jgi:predicted membrane metal-binding protein
MILGIIVFIFESLGRKEQEGPETRSGITTVLALPVVFLVASLAVFNSSFWLVATVLFVLLIILELKDKWHHFVSTIEKSELFDFSMLIAIALIINGCFLSFRVSPFLLQREQEGRATELLPQAFQRKIIVSLIISDLGWWGGLALLVVYLTRA